jgi:cytochrome c biogenesis protein CcdA
MSNKFKKLFYSLLVFLLALAPASARAVETCTIQNIDCLTPKSPTFWLITSSAFVDSINPCAIAVLLFVLSALVFFGDRKKILKVGTAFILGLYLTYFLFGAGIFYALKINTWINPGIFHWVMGIFGIVMGLLNIKDYFWYGGGGFLVEIPRKWRPKMSLLLAKATTVPVAFFTGILVTAFELPCTGGPYVFVLGVLSQSTSKLLILPILAYYNLLFSLPLIIIMLGVYWGFLRVDKTEHWKQKNIKKLHLVAGIVLVLLGLWVIPNSPFDYIIPLLASLFKSLFFISSRLSHFFLLFANPISSLIIPFFK